MKTMAQITEEVPLIKEVVNGYMTNLTMTQTLIGEVYPKLKKFHDSKLNNYFFMLQIKKNPVLSEASASVSEFIKSCEGLKEEVRQAQKDICLLMETHIPEHKVQEHVDELLESVTRSSLEFTYKMDKLQDSKDLTVGTLIAAFSMLEDGSNG